MLRKLTLLFLRFGSIPSLLVLTFGFMLLWGIIPTKSRRENRDQQENVVLIGLYLPFIGAALILGGYLAASYHPELDRVLIIYPRCANMSLANVPSWDFFGKAAIITMALGAFVLGPIFFIFIRRTPMNVISSWFGSACLFCLGALIMEVYNWLPVLLDRVLPENGLLTMLVTIAYLLLGHAAVLPFVIWLLTPVAAIFNLAGVDLKPSSAPRASSASGDDDERPRAYAAFPETILDPDGITYRLLNGQGADNANYYSSVTGQTVNFRISDIERGYKDGWRFRDY